MTQKGKWTPGPWRFQYFGDELFLVSDHGRRSVIIGGSRGSKKGLVTNGEDGVLAKLTPDHPNARLIAAAPEMAELLLAWTENLDAVKAAGPNILRATQNLLSKINGGL